MRRTRGERGAAAVEFALVVPVLLLLVLGITEFGRAYNVQTTLSGAAREGARAMAVQNSPAAARAAVQNAAAGIGLSDSQISVSPSACPSSSIGSGTTVQVTITYPLSFVTNFFGSSPITLRGTAVMRCNG
jgi:Flp pilus assembly protein TadG